MAEPIRDLTQEGQQGDRSGSGELLSREYSHLPQRLFLSIQDNITNIFNLHLLPPLPFATPLLTLNTYLLYMIKRWMLFLVV